MIMTAGWNIWHGKGYGAWVLLFRGMVWSSDSVFIELVLLIKAIVEHTKRRGRICQELILPYEISGTLPSGDTFSCPGTFLAPPLQG